MTDQEHEATETRPMSEIKRNPIVVQASNPLLDTGMFEQMNRVATAMASMKLVPGHLQGSIGDCLLVVEQAIRRGLSPTDLAQHTFVVHGKLGYEGKAVAAWCNTSPLIKGSLKYEYSGEGSKRKIVVSGTLVDRDEPDVIEGTVQQWATDNENWKKNPDQMLSYRGAREWARRHTPEILLGVSTEDDLQAQFGRGPEGALDISEHVTEEAPKRSQFKGEVEPPYSIVGPEGEILRELGAAEFADEILAMLSEPGCDYNTIVERHEADIERLSEKHKEGCYEPIWKLVNQLAYPDDVPESATQSDKPSVTDRTGEVEVANVGEDDAAETEKSGASEPETEQKATNGTGAIVLEQNDDDSINWEKFVTDMMAAIANAESVDAVKKLMKDYNQWIVQLGTSGHKRSEKKIRDTAGQKALA